MTIWKYTIETTDRQFLLMPKGAKILCVQMQHGEPRLWALVDPTAEKEPRDVLVCGTGRQVPEGNNKYIGAYQLLAGNLVFHVFEKE